MTGGRIGFYGKLPSRGDFVRIGVSRDAAAAWDGWVASVLPPARRSVGARWAETWRAGPAWRFTLAAGLCGPRPMTGLWLPSTDTAGRSFPLLVTVEAAVAPTFLAALEAIASEAIRHATEPDALAARLSESLVPEPAPVVPADRAVWWTEGTERPLRTVRASSMPDPTRFLSMLMP